jgi:ABC-type metal ion transport system substrate-binding protein
VGDGAQPKDNQGQPGQETQKNPGRKLKETKFRDYAKSNPAMLHYSVFMNFYKNWTIALLKL